MQEVVDATLLEKVKTSIERNKSLQVLYIDFRHKDVVDFILKGARGNTSLKQLTITLLSHDQVHLIEQYMHNTIGFKIIVINVLITFKIM